MIRAPMSRSPSCHFRIKMDKRYQVFVSSTFADLQDERQAVTQALLSLDHFPAGMELFPASDEDAWTLIKGVIDDSDYYVLVIGGRYGSTNEDGISYTEMEFEYASKSGIPVLAFVHEFPESIAAGKTDQNDRSRARLDSFKRRVQTGHHVKYWKNPDDLKAKVIQSISAETKRNPREGWVRAARASDPVVVEKLRQEIDRLNSELNSARTAAPAGTSKLAQEEDELEIKYNFETEDEYHFETEDCDGDLKLTWNEIFAAVSPSMINEVSDDDFRKVLNDSIERAALPGLREQGDFKNKTISNFFIKQNYFDKIKVQLRALGLITKSTKSRSIKDTNTYWTLTPYGDTVMTQLLAIQKSAIVVKNSA
jgi:uncharacterized protein DUF4062